MLKDGLDKNIITKEEYLIMDPEDKDAAKFCCKFKVHKQTEHKKIPPVRPIISGSGSITKNKSIFLERHIRDIAKKPPILSSGYSPFPDDNK